MAPKTARKNPTKKLRKRARKTTETFTPPLDVVDELSTNSSAIEAQDDAKLLQMVVAKTKTIDPVEYDDGSEVTTPGEYFESLEDVQAVGDGSAAESGLAKRRSGGWRGGGRRSTSFTENVYDSEALDVMRAVASSVVALQNTTGEGDAGMDEAVARLSAVAESTASNATGGDNGTVNGTGSNTTTGVVAVNGTVSNTTTAVVDGANLTQGADEGIYGLKRVASACSKCGIKSYSIGN